jgi:probable HAF family extracellular repeat protein
VNYDSTFDYPGGGNSTTPHSISNNGNIVGFFIDSNNARRGFQRSADGTFSPPLVHPNDTDNFSQARGINNDGLIVGSYRNPGVFHGLILDNGVYSTYDYGGPVSTELYGVNDAGDAVGAYGSTVIPNVGIYLPHGGSAIEIQPPDSTRVFAYAINNNGQIVGQYDDASGKVHGYLRQADGTYSTIDYPDATLTTARSINDLGWVSGFYQNADGSFHGYVLIDGVFVDIDQPAGKDTRAMAINNDGTIIGDFLDSPSGTLRHGFVAHIPIGDLPGDYNDDGVVDAGDYVLWQDNRSKLLTLPNDLTPGSVTIGDYNVWRANFGRTAGSGALSDTAVPEPASGVLLVITWVAVYVRRKSLAFSNLCAT